MEENIEINRQRDVLYVLAATILFSLGGLLVKMVPWNPLAINGVRNAISALIIGIYLKKTHHAIVINKAVLFGAAAMAGTTTLYCIANKLTTAANTIVLQFTAPGFVILLSFLLLKKKPKRLDLVAAAVMFLGIIFFFIDSLGAGDLLGDIVAVLSGVCYAGVFMMNSFEDSDSLSSIFLGQLLCGVTCFWFVFGETDFSAQAVGGILALGVLQLALAYIFMAKGLDRVSAMTASLTSAIEPILNPVLVAIFWHETISGLALVGAAIVITSVVVYNILSLASHSGPQS